MNRSTTFFFLAVSISDVRSSCLGTLQRFILCICVGSTVFAPTILEGQDYLTSTGTPSFATPYPVEMGIVDAASGNLHLEIPLGAFPQRGGRTVNVTLEYDSHIWGWPGDGIGAAWSPWINTDNSLYPGGWRLTLPSEWWGGSGNPIPSCINDVVFWDPRGTQHWFEYNFGYGTGFPPCPNSTSSSFAVDSSGYRLDGTVTTNGSATWELYAPDGTKVWDNASDLARLPEDSNGNFIAQGPENVTDTLGRELPTLLFTGGPQCVYTSPATVLDYSGCLGIPNSQGQSSQYNLTFATISLQTQFKKSGVTECSGSFCQLPVITSIILPDGINKYTFKYDCDSTKDSTSCASPGGQTAYYGMMIQMTMPTGQLVSYGYSNFTDVSGSVGRWITSEQGVGHWQFAQAVTAHGSFGTYNCGYAVSAFGCQQTTVTKPDNSKDVLTFAINNGPWLTNKVLYDTNAATVLSTEVETWDLSQPCALNTICGGVGASNVRKIKTATTLPVPSGSITKQTTYSYDSPQKGNVTAVKEWKFQSGTAPSFSATPDRATYTTYASIGTTNNINRPQLIAICNAAGTDVDCPGGGSKVSKATIVYDSYVAGKCPNVTGLVSVTGIQNHDDSFGTSVTQRGNPTSIQQWVAGSAALTTSLFYDTTGQTVESDDPAGNATCFTYTDNFYSDNGTDALVPYYSAQPTNAYLTNITDSVGTMTTGYYYGSGNLAVTTDYNGVADYSHFMDLFDRPTEAHFSTPPNSQATPPYTSWEVNTYASLILGDAFSPIADETASASCGSCSDSQAQLDSAGRLSAANLANNPAGAVSTSNTYDGLNRVATTSHPHIGSGDPNNVVETFQRDGLGRSRAMLHPDGEFEVTGYGANVGLLGGLSSQQGSATTYGYGFPVISVDEARKQSQEWIDGFGQIIEVDEPSESGSPGTGSVTISSGDRQVYQCPPGCRAKSCCSLVWDYGTVSVTLNGYTASANYDQSSSDQSIAAVLASRLSGPQSSVSATATGGVITITALGAGTGTNYSLSATSLSSVTGGSGSFTVATSGSTLSGGSGGISASPVVTNYTYDVLGNLISVVQGAQTRTWTYDGLSRLTKSVIPETGTTTFSYMDSSGALCSGDPANPCSRVDGRGITTTYSYDGANRPKQITHSDTTGTFSYTWGTSASAYNVGRLLTKTDPSGSETYTYDPMGRVTKVAKVIGSATYNISYAYNAGGLITGMTYPSGRKVYYSYDTVGHLCAVDVAAMTTCTPSSTPYLTVSSSNYDAAGRPLAWTYGNGVVGTASYLPQRSQLQNVSFSKGATTLFKLNYYYQKDSTNCPTGDALGNNEEIQCINDTVQPGRSASYTYDALSRLQTANTAGSTPYAAWGLSETFDRYGNRTAQAVTKGSGYASSLSISAATNRVTSFTYDGSGNVIAEPSPVSATFSYDAEECMTTFSGNGSGATYSCDENGVRMKKVVTGSNAVTTVYVRSGGEVIAEYDNGAAVSSPTREYVFGSHRLATITGSVSGAGGTIIYEHRDHLSPRFFTDANGNCVGDEATYPFGELWYSNNDPNCTNTTTSPWIFTSYERDPEGGLDYALARSYSGPLGRFMSPDPLGGSVEDPQSLNRYAYVVNDPVNGTDPSGQDDCFDTCDPGSDQIDDSSMAEGQEGSTPLGTQNPPVPAAEGCYLCGLLDRLRGLFGGVGGWGGDGAPPLLAQAGGGGIGGGSGGTGQNTSGGGRIYPPGFAGKLQPGDVYGPYTADLNRKDMAFAKTNYNPVKHFFGAKSEIPQCVALTKYFTNMPLDMRGNAQRAWRQGPAGQTPIRVVDMLATLKPGTAIGAGWFNGRWPSDGHPNSGVYIGPGQAPGSIRILDQWTGHWPQTRELRPRALYAADSSDMYYVIHLAPVP